MASNTYVYARGQVCLREIRIVCDDCHMSYRYWHWCNMQCFETSLGLPLNVNHYPMEREYVRSVYLDRLNREMLRKRRVRLRKRKERDLKKLLMNFCNEGWRYVHTCNVNAIKEYVLV